MQKQLINDLRYKLSPTRFAREILGFEPDDWQQQLLDSNSNNILLNCSRQSGKSTTTSILATHTAIYNPNSLILLISPSLRQSTRLFKKVASFYKTIPNKLALEEDNKLSMALENGSEIISLPCSEETIRGFSAVNLLIIDEASRVDDDLYRSVRPMLGVSNGKLIAMSTPFGKRGFFFAEWTEGGDAWERLSVDAYQVPRFSKEFLEKERKSLGEWWFKQEYLCEFVDTTDSVFSYDMIIKSISNEVKPLFLHNLPQNNYIDNNINKLVI